MPINRVFQKLKKHKKDGFHLICNPSKIKGCRASKFENRQKLSKIRHFQGFAEFYKNQCPESLINQGFWAVDIKISEKYKPNETTVSLGN